MPILACIFFTLNWLTLTSEMHFVKIHPEVASCLGTASKPNRRLTGGSVRFRPVSFVLNNDNRPEPDGTAGQPAVGFWSRPLLSRGKRKYAPLGMRLLWKYIRNYFLVYHLTSHFLLYLQKYKEFEAEILDLQLEYGLSFDIKNILLQVEPWGMRMWLA